MNLMIYAERSESAAAMILWWYDVNMYNSHFRRHSEQRLCVPVNMYVIVYDVR